LAATGASVTVFDNSPRQLARDAEVAEREGLAIRLVEGDMRDLSVFAEASFDLIFHPVSNLFVPDILPVWREAFRVLRPGGWLLAGFVNPVEYSFDVALYDEGIFTVKHPLPYNDVEHLTPAERDKLFGPNAAVEFSHSLDTQIGGQLSAGFMLTGLYESRRAEGDIANYMPSYIATRALKPSQG
jgi:SAM-dependent methyltransferase